MTIAIIQHTSVGSAGANGVTSGSLDTTVANLLVLVGAFASAGTGVGVSDSKSNTWTALTLYSSSPSALRIWYCFTPTVGSGHTFTISGTNIYASLGILAASGVNAFGGEAGSAVGTGGTSYQSSSGVTPSSDNALVIAGCFIGASGTSASYDGGFTSSIQNYLASNRYGGGIGYLIQTTAAAANPTVSWTPTATGRAANLAWFSAATSGLSRLAGSRLVTPSIMGGGLVRN